MRRLAVGTVLALCAARARAAHPQAPVAAGDEATAGADRRVVSGAHAGVTAVAHEADAQVPEGQPDER
jgi:hypothetical protein